MKALFKSLLPKKLNDREALKHESSNIKPRFTKGFWRLSKYTKIIFTIILVIFLNGLHPVASFPLVQQTISHAREQGYEQQITTEVLPILSLAHPGYLSTPYSKYHPGIDIATGLGMPIHSITDGVVEEVIFSFFGYGNHIIVSHQAGLKSLYGHMDRVYVKVGQNIVKSDTLGTVGLTGFTSGAHTHLEITRHGKLIDPQTVLPKIENYPQEEDLKPVNPSLGVGGKNPQGSQIRKVYPTPSPKPDLTKDFPFNSIRRSTPNPILFPFPIN